METSTIPLRIILQNTVDGWERVGYPALLERFILKYGEEFRGSKRPKGVRKWAMKECFRNTSHRLLRVPHSDYYEGYAMSDEFQFPFLHAWNIEEGRVVDLTLKDPEKYQYLGMKFSEKVLWHEQVKHGVYGILDPGMINLDLLRSIDNDLVEKALGHVHSRRKEADPRTGSEEMGPVDGRHRRGAKSSSDSNASKQSKS